jgi:hypothetical protein
MVTINRGSIVCRKDDPVHVGRVTYIIKKNGVRLMGVHWFTGILEFVIPERELQLTREWK